MPRPKIIHIPIEHPHCCQECPLLGRRPPAEIPRGNKYVHLCFFPGIHRLISGRGSHQPKARNRCKPKEWSKLYATYNGDIPVPHHAYYTYQLDRFTGYERDRRLYLQEHQSSH